jgi:drug/metabolite transporter (DMT)-like permease
MMELLGVGLGVTVALLWGSGDILATLAARRFSTFKTTFVSQSVGLLGLLAFGTIAFWLWKLPFTLTAFTLSALIGIFTGACAALGYFALYRALEIGPIAITGPLTAASPIFTLILSAFILKEHVTLEQKEIVTIGILGIVLASTSLAELRILLKKPGFSLWSHGVRWAVVATFAFGALDFGIGASVSVSNWFFPALWTRFFTILFLTLFSCGKRYQWLPWAQATAAPSSNEETLSFSLPSLKDFAHVRKPFSKIGSGILLALLVGMMENAAVLTFSLDTRIATTGITSAITSSYALVVMVFGMIVYRERPAKNQLLGIVMFMICLFSLAF